MADGAGHKANKETGLYDPRRDANWQARLEEARAKREIALRNKPKAKPKKRLKPWEEEGAVAFDDDKEFSPAAEGLEFSDRVEAMREHREDDKSSTQTSPGEALTKGLSNWSEDAEQSVLPQVEPRPKAAKLTVVSDRSAAPRRAGSVNDIFADPVFDQPIAEPETQETKDDETIPIALLRVPPPEPAPPSRPRYEPEPEPEPVVMAPVPPAETAPEKKRSGVWAVAALFVGAIAIGPIYKFTQPVERGPLVFTLSAFPIEPAFGLTSPMFEQPTPTRSGEWTPASRVPTDEPLMLAQPNVPQRARELANFVEAPVFGPDASSILLGAQFEALPETPVNFALPVVLPERPIGPSGQVAGLARDFGDLSQPAPRPDTPANG